MQNFNNKVIWITGASSGIGEALVYEFAKQQATIVLSARRVEELQRVQKQAKLDDTNSLILPFDLEDTSKAQEYVAIIKAKFGQVDVLVNNGGMSQRGLSQDTPEDLERKIMEINYFSATNLTKAVLPIMLKQEKGQIVVISSIAGKFGFYLRSSYSAAKHALHGYFESLRLETEKSGISVLLVCPGKIKTNISNSAVLADGKVHNQMDPSHQNAMSAKECAQKIIKAIQQNKEEIFVGGKELKAVSLKRFFPKLFGKVIRKQSPF